MYVVTYRVSSSSWDTGAAAVASTGSEARCCSVRTDEMLRKRMIVIAAWNVTVWCCAAVT